MCGYPGATFHLDFRQGMPKTVQEYYVTLLPQADVQHVVHTHNGKSLVIPPSSITKMYPLQQPSQESSVPAGKDSGETVRGPLGWLVHARSGDKSLNANVGFWVRHQDEYNWMRTLLSTGVLKGLLAKEYNGKNIVSLLPIRTALCVEIDRLTLTGSIRVSEFVGCSFSPACHLDQGACCSSAYDFLANNVAEFLRSRYVDLPKRFLNRGKL